MADYNLVPYNSQAGRQHDAFVTQSILLDIVNGNNGPNVFDTSVFREAQGYGLDPKLISDAESVNSTLTGIYQNNQSNQAAVNQAFYNLFPNKAPPPAPEPVPASRDVSGQSSPVIVSNPIVEPAPIPATRQTNPVVSSLGAPFVIVGIGFAALLLFSTPKGKKKVSTRR